jgi:hypothetical protein
LKLNGVVLEMPNILLTIEARSRYWKITPWYEFLFNITRCPWRIGVRGRARWGGDRAWPRARDMPA